MRRNSHWKLPLLPLALVVLLGLPGCGERLQPVKGKVTLEDGTPLTQGMVIFETIEGGKPVSARGALQADGSFQLSTYKMEDGVPPGRYRALINPMDLSDIPDEQKNLPFDIKYMKFETSGLEYEVKPGAPDLQIKLARGKMRNR